MVPWRNFPPETGAASWTCRLSLGNATQTIKRPSNLTRRFNMSDKVVHLSRRRFLRAAAVSSALVAAPQLIPASALGKDGAVAPSDRIVLGGIGIGNRGTYDLGCFLPQPDVRFVAVCDVKAVAPRGGQEAGRSSQVRQPQLRHLSRSARVAGPQRHRRRVDRHRAELARHGRDPGGQRRQGRVLREALHEEHRPKPGAGRDVPPHGPRLPGRHAAAQPAAFRLRRRTGPQRQARQAADRLCPSRRAWRPA